MTCYSIPNRTETKTSSVLANGGEPAKSKGGERERARAQGQLAPTEAKRLMMGVVGEASPSSPYHGIDRVPPAPSLGWLIACASQCCCVSPTAQPAYPTRNLPVACILTATIYRSGQVGYPLVPSMRTLPSLLQSPALPRVTHQSLVFNLTKHKYSASSALEGGPLFVSDCSIPSASIIPSWHG